MKISPLWAARIALSEISGNSNKGGGLVAKGRVVVRITTDVVCQENQSLLLLLVRYCLIYVPNDMLFMWFRSKLWSLHHPLLLRSSPRQLWGPRYQQNRRKFMLYGVILFLQKSSVDPHFRQYSWPSRHWLQTAYSPFANKWEFEQIGLLAKTGLLIIREQIGIRTNWKICSTVF